jgi:hypothetical protein
MSVTKEISSTVGPKKRNKNKKSDVVTVRTLLNPHISSGLLLFQGIDKLPETHAFDKQLETAIKAFQLRVFLRDDGIVSPTGPTLVELNKKTDSPLSRIQLLANTRSVEDPPSTPHMDAIPEDLWHEGMLGLISHSFNSLIQKPEVVTLVDFRLPNTQRRMWTIDIERRIILVNTLVSHGRGSVEERKSKKVPTLFGNGRGSNKSSLGSYVALWSRRAKAGSKDKATRRIALVIEGLDSSNSAARGRGIIFHGAHYVTKKRAGMSLGCFATEQSVNDGLVPLLQHGSFIYAYGP